MTSALALVAGLLLGQAYPQAEVPSPAQPPASAEAAPAARGTEAPPAAGQAAAPARAVRAPPAPASTTASEGSASSAAASDSPSETGAASSESAPPASPTANQDDAGLEAEVAALRGQVASLEQSLEAERARGDALAERVRADEEARRAEAEAAARSPGERAADTGAATASMGGALEDLTRGDASGVGESLAADAQTLQAARAEAVRRGAAREAQLAGAASSWIDAAREALSRSDLYQARIALGQAAVAAAQANALAREAAGAAAQPGQAAPPRAGY